MSINGLNSDLADTNWGVPQGSILGPLLFLLYINDLHCAIKCYKVHRFADDSNLMKFKAYIKTNKKQRNHDQKNLSNRLSANKIALNVTKRKFAWQTCYA